MLGILPQSYIPSLRSPFPCVWWGGDAFAYACGGQRSGILLYHSPLHLLRIELSDWLENSLDPLLCNNGVMVLWVCAAMPVFMWVLRV